MTDKNKHSGNLTLLGGKKCLDFINTLDWRGREQPVEYLNNYADIIRWGVYVKILKPDEAEHYRQFALQNTHESENALSVAIELRELLHRIFLNIQSGKTVQLNELDRLNHFVKKTLASMSIKQSITGFTMEARVDSKTLTGLLNPIIWDAVTLLTTDDRLQIKSCADKTCGWMFFDTSKNKSRQWCDMKSCGNRAKARKYYQLKKQSKMDDLSHLA